MKAPLVVEARAENITVGKQVIVRPQDGVAVRKSLPYVAVMLCSVLYMLPFMRLPIRGLDEGTFLHGAVRVLEGQVPFRDFFEVMGPGSFYWLALFFKIFGTTWFVTRVSLTVCIVCTTLLVYFLSRRLGSRPSVFPAVFLLAVSFSPAWPAISHHVDSNLFALLSFATLVIWLEKRYPALICIAGALAALTSCFLLPKGILLFLSLVAAVWILCRRESTFRRSMAWLWMGYLAVTVCVAGLFWTAGALGDLIYANLLWPIQHYSNVNVVPYGYGLQFYWDVWAESLGAAVSRPVGCVVAGILVTPFLILAALPVALLLFAIRFRSVAFQTITLPYWLAGCALWISEFHRRDITHLAWGSPILVILCFHLYGQLRSKFYERGLQFVAVCVCALAAFNCLIAQMTPTQKIMTRRGAIYSSGSDAVLEFLNSRVRSGESIFIYPYHPMYYYLAAVENPTRYSILMYDMNTRDQFQETVKSLEQSKVRYILWDRAFERERVRNVFPEYRAPSQQQLIMEPYLAAKYQVLSDVGGFRVLERRGESETARRGQ